MDPSAGIARKPTTGCRAGTQKHYMRERYSESWTSCPWCLALLSFHFQDMCLRRAAPSSVGQRSDYKTHGLTELMAGFPGGSVVKNLPANTAEKQLSLCASTTEPALSSPGAPTATEAHEPYSPCPSTRDATAVRSHSTTREKPLLTTARKKPVQQWSPSTAKNK